MKLEVENVWLPQPTCSNDTAIMDLATLYDFSPAHLWHINLCRLFLQVFWLSDITTADGKTITHHVIIGFRDSSRTSQLHWPTHQCPKSWNTWNLFLQYFSTGGHLTESLGTWLWPPHQIWQWFFDLVEDKVYHFPTASSTTVIVYTPVQRSRRTRHMKKLYSNPPYNRIGFPVVHFFQWQSTIWIPVKY